MKAHGLRACDFGPLTQGVYHGGHLGLALAWHDYIDQLADHTLSGVIKQALRAGVPTENNAVQGLADDGIVTGID